MNSNLFKPDPAYQQHVPNLDGGDGASEHIIFGTNIDCENGVERGKGYCHAFNSYVSTSWASIQVLLTSFLILQVNLLHFLDNLKYNLLSTTCDIHT